MVRSDDGVLVFGPGDRDTLLIPIAASSDPVGGVCGNGGGPWSIESLFMRRVSVGLTVLAPNPDA